jgi:hypothetical protein
MKLLYKSKKIRYIWIWLGIGILLVGIISLYIQHCIEPFDQDKYPKVCFYYHPSPILHDALSGGELAILKFIKMLNAQNIKYIKNNFK